MAGSDAAPRARGNAAFRARQAVGVPHRPSRQSLRRLKAHDSHDRATVLKLECASESPGGLLTAQLAQPRPHASASC